MANRFKASFSWAVAAKGLQQPNASSVMTSLPQKAASGILQATTASSTSASAALASAARSP